MNLDRILHERKNFIELDDADTVAFLRSRSFGSEHLNLEFKREFPQRSGRRYDIREICKYIVAFSNGGGGIIVYGVADSVRDPARAFEDYVPGLSQRPSLEDLSQWVIERIRPLVQSPAIRTFDVEGQEVLIIKVPSGIDKPYSYCEPSSNALTFFTKTAGGIQELSPAGVRDLYRMTLLEQAEKTLRATGALSRTTSTEDDERDRLSAHKAWAVSSLEDVNNFGHVGIYCFPLHELDIPVIELRAFFEGHRFNFSESLRFAPRVEVLQNGVWVGFFPRAVRQDIKSTIRTTAYADGLIAYDAQADTTMDRDQNLHPYWLAYELQRHLQLTKAILVRYGVERVRVFLDLDHIENFHMRFGERFDRGTADYSGRHRPIERDIPLTEINDYDGENRNIVTPPVISIMDEVCQIFGLSGTPRGVWDERGYLHFVRGLEGQR